MNAVYFSMNKTSETINLPIELDMGNKDVLLFEVDGTVHPYTRGQLFLCADFVESSIVNSNLQMPILRQINLRKRGKKLNIVVDSIYTKILWIPANRTPVKEIRVYLTYEHGNAPPFTNCNITGMLICIPHVIRL